MSSSPKKETVCLRVVIYPLPAQRQLSPDFEPVAANKINIVDKETSKLDSSPQKIIIFVMKTEICLNRPIPETPSPGLKTGYKITLDTCQETALRTQKMSLGDFLITTPLQATNSRFRQRLVVEPHIPGGSVECDIKQFSVGIDVD
jgi:hypothetical protein